MTRRNRKIKSLVREVPVTDLSLSPPVSGRTLEIVPPPPKKLNCYSITIRTGKGFDLGLQSNSTALDLVCFQPHWVYSIEKENTLGEHLQAGIMSDYDIKELRKDLLSLYPDFTPAQKKNAIKVEDHSCWLSLQGYCLKDSSVTNFGMSDWKIYTDYQCRWIYQYMSWKKCIYPPDEDQIPSRDTAKYQLTLPISWPLMEYTPEMYLDS